MVSKALYLSHKNMARESSPTPNTDWRLHMWTLANINKIWILFLNGEIVLASKKWDLHDAQGEFITSGVKMREYAPKELGAPDQVERVRAFTLEQIDKIGKYFQKIGVQIPATLPVKQSPIDAWLTNHVAQKPPLRALQKPVVVKPKPTAEEVARLEAAEEDRIHRDLVKRVADALDCEVVELSNMMTVHGNDDVGRSCLALVKNLDIIPYINREKTQGNGTRSRNRWFAEKLKRLVAELAFAEKRVMEDSYQDIAEDYETYV